MADQSERLGRLEVKVEAALQGVSNFREFQQDARAFFTRHDAREEQAEETESKRHAENQTKINIILVIVAIATAIIMGVGIYVSVQVAKHADGDPGKLFHSYAPIQAYSIGTDAKIPTLGR